MSKLDPEIIKVLIAAGLPPEVATDHDVILADNMLKQAHGDIRLAAKYLRAARREKI